MPISFICNNFSVQDNPDVGLIYNFSSALTRLYQAAHEGYRHLYIAAKKEQHVIPTLETCYPLKYDDRMTVDTYTNQLFLFSGMKDMGIPVRVTGNGNCFFNSLSMALCGSEEMSTELRVRCTIDMVLIAALHQDIPDSDYIWHLSPSYEEACISAATDKARSSAWSFKSAANVVGITIRSVYSLINSKKCKAFQRSNCLNMDNVAGIPPNSRRPLANLIFGDNGLENANDSFEFESLSEQVIDACGDNQGFKEYFRNNLQPKLLKHVNIPKRTDNEKKLWTNNNSESMNNILKLSVEWRPQNTPDLIDKLYSVTKLQLIDLRRAIYGSGNYVLSSDQSVYSVPELKWREKDNEEKQKIFKNFLKGTKKKF